MCLCKIHGQVFIGRVYSPRIWQIFTFLLDSARMLYGDFFSFKHSLDYAMLTMYYILTIHTEKVEHLYMAV